MVINSNSKSPAFIEYQYLIRLIYRHYSSSIVCRFYLLTKFKAYLKLNDFFFKLNDDTRFIEAAEVFNFFKAPTLHEKFNIQPIATIAIKNYLHKDLTMGKVLNVLCIFNYFFNKNFFYTHHNFDYYVLKSFKNNLIIIKFQKFLKRWEDGLNFLFNLYFYNLKPLIFGNLLFKKETLALNWNLKVFDIALWRFYSAFFIDKKIQFDTSSDYFFTQIKSSNIRFFFITDVNNQYKNNFFFRKNYFFTIGLINIFINPWLVDYPFFIFSDSYISQLFFFKLLIFLCKKSLYLKFSADFNSLIAMGVRART